jgi:hypothetical protein
VVRWRPHAVAWALTIASAASLLGAAPELREGLKLHQQDVLQFVAVRHFNWKKATELVSERAGPSDVIVSSRALLSKYYGARLPLFFLNNDDLSLMLEQNLRRGDGTLIEYTAGAELIVDLAGLRRVVAEHPAGWFVTERIRLTSASSFPRDVVRFVEDHFQPEVVPGAPDMAVWRWPAPEGGGTTAK